MGLKLFLTGGALLGLGLVTFFKGIISGKGYRLSNFIIFVMTNPCLKIRKMSLCPSTKIVTKFRCDRPLCAKSNDTIGY